MFYHKKKIVLIVILALLLPLTVVHQLNKCNLIDFYKVSKSFGFASSFFGCYERISSTINTRVFSKISGEDISKNMVKFSKEDLKDIKNNKDIEIPKTKIGLINEIEPFLTNKRNLAEKKTTSWFRSHGGNDNLKHSASNEINRNNAKELELYWEYSNDFDAKKWRQNVETNPIFFNGTIFTVTADNKLLALDIINKKLKWEIQSNDVIAKRGFVIDNDITAYLYVPIGEKIFKINSMNGKIDSSFGIDGSIKYKTIVAPFIFDDKICAAGLASLACYDKNKGNNLFTIKLKDINDVGGIIWGGVAFDPYFKIAYVVTGNPRPALIGINRKNLNKNSNSLLAIDLIKKKIIWKVKDVYHDLWDYDIAHPPVVTDIKFENGYFPAVITVGKTGNVHIVHRVNGKHLFDVKYKKVPKSLIPGEYVSTYQIDMQTPDKLIDLDSLKKTIELSNIKNKDIILEDLSNSIYGEFVPPQLGKKLITLGLHGGATWPGSSINPSTSTMFTPINLVPFSLRVYAKTNSKKTPKNKEIQLALYENYCASCHGKYRNGTNKPSQKKDIEILRNYIPSLVGHSIMDKKNFELLYNLSSFEKNHKDIKIENNQLQDIKKLFEDWDKTIMEDQPIFLDGFWSKYVDENEFPAYPTPWGKIISMDLKTGKIIWEKNLGMIKRESITEEGSIMYGGIATNDGGIAAVTGTTDNKVYLLDQNTGNILWDYEMENAGSSPPIIFSIANKEYVGIVSTGGLFKDYKKKGSKFYIFSLK